MEEEKGPGFSRFSSLGLGTRLVSTFVCEEKVYSLQSLKIELESCDIRFEPITCQTESEHMRQD